MEDHLQINKKFPVMEIMITDDSDADDRFWIYNGDGNLTELSEEEYKQWKNITVKYYPNAFQMFGANYYTFYTPCGLVN